VSGKGQKSVGASSGQGASMTKSDSQRIQSSQALGGHHTGKDSFASRAQAAGDKQAAGRK
jgi:hypothetical protein